MRSQAEPPYGPLSYPVTTSPASLLQHDWLKHGAPRLGLSPALGLAILHASPPRLDPHSKLRQRGRISLAKYRRLAERKRDAKRYPVILARDAILQQHKQPRRLVVPTPNAGIADVLKFRPRSR